MHKIESDIPKEIRWAGKMVYWMDDAFKVPFINFRFGLDPLIGLIPWAGDIVSFAISGLILKSLVSAGLPRRLIWKMFGNIAFDFGVGLIPLIGDVWDFFKKANRKNLLLAREYFDSQREVSPTDLVTMKAWPYTSETS